MRDLVLISSGVAIGITLTTFVFIISDEIRKVIMVKRYEKNIRKIAKLNGIDPDKLIERMWRF